MGQFGRPLKKCRTVKKLTSGGFSSMTTSAITSAAPQSKRGSSSTREVARFFCNLGEYLMKEVVLGADQPGITDETLGASNGGGSLQR